MGRVKTFFTFIKRGVSNFLRRGCEKSILEEKTYLLPPALHAHELFEPPKFVDVVAVIPFLSSDEFTHLACEFQQSIDKLHGVISQPERIENFT